MLCTSTANYMSSDTYDMIYQLMFVTLVELQLYNCNSYIDTITDLNTYNYGINIKTTFTELTIS